MIAFSITLFHGFFICLLFSVFAFLSFWWRPRLWLHSLPPDIRRMAPAKTKSEKIQTRFILLPAYLVILPGLSLLSTIYIVETQPHLSFGGAVLHLYGIWILVHLWDFVAIDCGFALLIDAHHPPIPGTEGAKGWKDYGFHFRSLLKAIAMSALFVVPAAACVVFMV